MATTHYHHIQPEIIALLVCRRCCLSTLSIKRDSIPISTGQNFYIWRGCQAFCPQPAILVFWKFFQRLTDFAILISQNFEWFVLILFAMVSATRLIMPKGQWCCFMPFSLCPRNLLVLAPGLWRFSFWCLERRSTSPSNHQNIATFARHSISLHPEERPVLLINLFMNLMKLGAIPKSPYWRHLGLLV